MDTLSQTPIPSPSSEYHEQPRVLAATFGGGYEQRSGDGPTGRQLRDWSLVWENISRVQMKALTDFFRTQEGYKKFKWTQLIPFATEGEKTYICEEWGGRYLGGDCHEFAAKLLERPPI